MKVRGHRIGIDAFSLFFLFREKRDEFKAYLQSLLALDHKLTFVMDKRAAKEKREVVEERKEIRKEAKADADATVIAMAEADDAGELDTQQQEILKKHIALKERDAWCLYPEYVSWFKTLLHELGIPLEWASEEADEVLAAGDYDVVISSDSDLLILGVKRLWIYKGKHTEICRDDFSRFIGLEGEQLFQMAFLAGCDVQPRIIVPIKIAVSWMRFYKSLNIIQKKHPDVVTMKDLEDYEKLRASVWCP